MKLKKRLNRLPAYTFPGCVVTHHRSKSCRALCVPIHGIGACGRIAPHSMLSKIQLAIAAHKDKLIRQAENDDQTQAATG